MNKKNGLSLGETVLFGMLGALTIALQVVMAPLPNIEPVSLLVMLFAAVFGWKSLYCVYTFVVLGILFHGIGLWNINYLYIWTVLAVAALLSRKIRNPLWWAMLSGVFGMAFGLLCSPVYMCIGGFDYGIRWWLSGIAFDIPHAIGNFVIALVLFVPLRKLLEKLYQKTI